jgi:hypothetical protein
MGREQAVPAPVPRLGGVRHFSQAGIAMAEQPEREAGWSLQASAVRDGVRLELTLPASGGQPLTAAVILDRAEARAFARALLAAAGDAAERTFPHPDV